eukprot:CAMPEP_0184504342 /NCGR_PEP_ID=MMETSP0113_2-20130426/52415_1 /TAXON_ID=91329 /ORGANISM="Norrisiella sphaerica, Strain BC52" /LENGTH=187 /DNA_ID=CAMNT_0026893983 /DNA_START=194 /DNA_END=757 /DNA_ORIENTATION=-
MESGIKEAWISFTRRVHKLSNKGLVNVYDKLKQTRSRNFGSPAETFTQMQEAMIQGMEDMVLDLNRKLRPHLQKVWNAYMKPSGKEEDKSGKINVSERFMEHSTWERLCKDNLIVEIARIEHDEPLIIEQAVINAVKPIDVVTDSTQDYAMIEVQKKIAKQNILNSKEDIIKQHYTVLELSVIILYT